MQTHPNVHTQTHTHTRSLRVVQMTLSRKGSHVHKRVAQTLLITVAKPDLWGSYHSVSAINLFQLTESEMCCSTKKQRQANIRGCNCKKSTHCIHTYWREERSCHFSHSSLIKIHSKMMWQKDMKWGKSFDHTCFLWKMLQQNHSSRHHVHLVMKCLVWFVGVVITAEWKFWKHSTSTVGFRRIEARETNHFIWRVPYNSTPRFWSIP